MVLNVCCFLSPPSRPGASHHTRPISTCTGVKPVHVGGHQDGAGSVPASPCGSFPLQQALLHGEEDARNLISLTRRSLTVVPIIPLPIHLPVFKTVKQPTNNGWLWYT